MSVSGWKMREGGKDGVRVLEVLEGERVLEDRVIVNVALDGRCGKGSDGSSEQSKSELHVVGDGRGNETRGTMRMGEGIVEGSLYAH